MRVLITGATGFLGYHITKACLDVGHEVLCLRRTTSKNPFAPEYAERIQWFELGEKELVQDFAPEVLIHAAWVGLNQTERHIWDVQFSNVALQEEILGLYDYKQCIVLSSIEEYGYPGTVMTEELSLKPFSAYGKAKITCFEQFQTHLSNREQEWQWLRVSQVYGERQEASWLIPNLLFRCLRGEPQIETTLGEQRCTFLWGEDFGNAVTSVIGKKGKSGIYNLGSSGVVYLYELFELVADVTSYSGSFTKNLPYRDGTSLEMVASTDKFIREFGAFERISLREGLEILMTTIQKSNNIEHIGGSVYE